MSQEIVPPKAVPMSTTAPVRDPETLRQEVSRLLDMDLRPEHDDVNLFELGLQSMQLMVLTNKLNRAGARVDFRRLSAEPRLSAWYQLLADVAGGAPAPEPADRRPARDVVLDTEEPFPLTAVQQAYWIGRGDDQPLGGVGCHAYLELDARDVDADRLERAVRALLDLHPMLRARFEADGTQRVLARSPWPGLTVHDFGDLSAEGAARALEELRGRLSHRRLDVGVGEVLDLQLSRLPGAGHRLHLNVDLLVADVHSIRLLLADLASLYEDPTSVNGPAYTFQRYLAERAETRQGERETARAYWQRRLPELPGGPRLPLAVEPAALPVTRFVRRTHELAPGEWRALRQRAARAGVTP
ncbi:condensation domain-containing protein, partial [Streptomyces sp. TRM76130]|nr:condensation domain-containing protein [Streptomyces sp. TRM76130]